MLPLRSEPSTPLLRPEPPMPPLRSEPPMPPLRLEPPTPLLRSEPPYAPSPLGAAYALSPGASAHTLYPTNARYRLGNPTVAPGHTYQSPQPQFPPILAGSHFPSSTQPPLASSPPRPPTSSWHSPPPPPRATPPSWHSPPTPYSPPLPPPRTTTPGCAQETVDLSNLPPPPPPRPVYQSHSFHPSIMDETGLFSKETQRILDGFVADIGGPDLSRRFKGVVNPETVTSLDMTNDPVIFVEQFRAGFARLPPWSLPLTN